MQDNPFQSVFDRLNSNKYIIRNRTARERIQTLSRLEKAILSNREAFREAIFKDFRKPFIETDITELYVILKEIRYAKSNLRNWMRPLRVPAPLALLGTSSEVIRESKGICLILSPWNYPLNLSLAPMVSAIAAGNVIVLKPSELTPNLSALLKKFIEDTFNDSEVTVIEGGKDTAEQLLRLPFDHIFYTGGTRIGSIVMQAAANSLTSVTLELGGKSPVYVHYDAAIKDAAAKITGAKLVNAGQSCIAPDYILAHADIADQLCIELEKSSKNFFDPGKTEDQPYASIINSEHYNRLLKLSEHDETDPSLRRRNILPPIIIRDAKQDSELMNDEIFGPVLPVIRVQNEAEALKIMHGHHEPLAIYIFTVNKKIKEFFRKNTSSGSICYNECAVQFLNPALPFGGIHGSGIGRSHGHAGFMEFSNERVLFNQRIGLTTAKLLYPPYSGFKKKIVDLLLKYL